MQASENSMTEEPIEKILRKEPANRTGEEIAQIEQKVEVSYHQNRELESFCRRKTSSSVSSGTRKS